MIKFFGPILFIILFSSGASASELSEIKINLTIVQSRIDLERARYQEAKAKMERSELVAKYLLPELQERERVLQNKIAKLETEKKKNQEDR